MTKSEFTRIGEIEAILGAPSTRTRIGIGDDTAVLRSLTGEALFCSDAMVEGIHFDLSFATAEEIGHKALAACLSDIAAMNGRPVAAVVSLALPKTIPDSFLRDFYKGAKTLVQRVGVDIVGGDLTSSPGPIFIDVSCLGETTQPTLRSGVKAGDLIAVSGTPGASAAGLSALRAGRATDRLRTAHLRPMPRFDLLPKLNESANNERLCHAAIDISDGLSSELHHLAKASGVSIEIEASAVPLHPDAVNWAREIGSSALDWALSGGEDYELLVALNSSIIASKGLPEGFTRIGQAHLATPAQESRVTLIHPDGRKAPLATHGFDHFR